MESGDLAQLARASALQAEGQGFKSPNLHTKLLFDITRDGNDKHVMIPLWNHGNVKQHDRSFLRGAPRQLGARGSAEWGNRREAIWPSERRARRRMPWGAGAKKAVASHERPGGAADAL